MKLRKFVAPALAIISFHSYAVVQCMPNGAGGMNCYDQNGITQVMPNSSGGMTQSMPNGSVGLNTYQGSIAIPETVPPPVSEITQNEVQTRSIKPVGLTDGLAGAGVRGAAMGIVLTLLYVVFYKLKKFYIQRELHDFVHSFRGRLFISANIVWIALVCFIRFGFDPYWMQTLFKDHEERFYYVLFAPIFFISTSTFLWTWTIRGKDKT
ncbi:MAG: hypothetical protein KGM83_05825 [Betaproteobacteria bacterium]|nr:hypothetical protein [Betaproteobacteria bacterium]